MMMHAASFIILVLLLPSISVAGSVESLPLGDASVVDGKYPAKDSARSAAPMEAWVTVEASASMKSGESVARKTALMSAYRKAINKGGTIEVSEFSQLRNFKDVIDVVTKRTHGYIKEHKVISEGVDENDANKYIVKLQALVVDRFDNGKANDQAIHQLVDLIGNPRVLFLLAESKVDGSNVSSVLRSDGAQDDGQTTAEHVMAKAFKEVGYEILTSDDIAQHESVGASELMSAQKGAGSVAAKIGRLVNADIVVAGKVRFQTRVVSGAGTDVNASMGNVSLSAKVVLPGNGKVLAVTTKRQRFMSLQGNSSLAAKENSIAKAAKKAANELKWSVPNILANETRDIEIVVNKASFSNSDKLRLYLSKLQGVEKILSGNWSKKTSSYTVKSVLTGPRETDLARLITKKFNGLDVESIQNYKVVLTY
jgi:hypothetical protein